MMSALREIAGGITGKILRVDLARRTARVEPSGPHVLRTLGGRGTNSLVMLDEIGPGTRWDDPGAAVFRRGFPGRDHGAGRQPRGRVVHQRVQRRKGIRECGRVLGRRAEVCRLRQHHHRGQVPGARLSAYRRRTCRDPGRRVSVGKTTFETERLLRETLGDERVRIAGIGPAGENRVWGSAVIVDSGHAAGGCGVGCVMGDKNLKAIAVRGHGKINVAHPERFLATLERCHARRAKEPRARLMRDSYMCTYADPDLENWDAVMVVRNGQDDHWPRERRARLMDPATGVPAMRKAVSACFGCPTGCIPFMEIPEDPYRGTRGRRLLGECHHGPRGAVGHLRFARGRQIMEPDQRAGPGRRLHGSRAVLGVRVF